MMIRQFAVAGVMASACLLCGSGGVAGTGHDADTEFITPMERLGAATTIPGGAVLSCGNAAMTALAEESVAATPTLELNVAPGTEPAEPGDEIIVRLRMTDLGQWQAAGFQAFLEYDPDRLKFDKAIYSDEPFGLPVIEPVQPVNVEDLFLLLAEWGACAPDTACPADLNCDGEVNVDDLFILLASWSSPA